MTAPYVWTVRFRAPDRYMSMNDRDHWRAKACRVKAWRHAAYAHATNARFHVLVPCTVQLTLDVPDSRRRDPHNYYPTVKAVVDGLVDAGCWPDDTPEYVTTLEPILNNVRRAPRFVTVCLTERTAQ